MNRRPMQHRLMAAFTAAKTCAALAGLVQFGLGVTLLVLSGVKFQRAGQGSCVYAPAENFRPAVLTCDSLAWLAFLTIASSLIISVTQGACSLVMRFPPRCVEVLLRIGLVGCWAALAIVATIATIKADHVDGGEQRRHWRHVGLAMAWAMTGLSIVFASTALLGLCCVDLPLLACCCCLPCCRRYDVQWRLCDPLSASGAWSCLEALGLLWLADKLFPEPGATPGATSSYQPLPQDECLAPHMQLHMHPQGPGQPPTSPMYAPPVIMEAPLPDSSYPPAFPHVLTPAERNQPLMAPVYAPFSHGRMPATVGWGVPVERPHHTPLHPAIIHPPQSSATGPRPQLMRSASWQHRLQQEQHQAATAAAAAAATAAASGSMATGAPGERGGAYPVVTAAWWPDDHEGPTPSTSGAQVLVPHDVVAAPCKEGYEPPSASPPPPRGG